MKFVFVTIACLTLLAARSGAEIAEFPSFYFWKESYASMEMPTIVGTWRKPKKTQKSDADVTYIFTADGKASIEGVSADGAQKWKTSLAWRQRDNGMIYLLRPELKRYVYIGYVDKGSFVADQFCYHDVYSRVKNASTNK